MKLVFSSLCITVFSLSLAGCSSSPTKTENAGRYSINQDRGPDELKDVSNIPDAVPEVLPYSKYGNGPTYTVWGKTYQVMPTHIGYKAEGLGSWYGQKFHGHRTSSGEMYDLYGMTAAHKTLPIPSFAKVTDLDNGRSVIVKVNDRGPFHSDRIMDLSYAAAAKLGYVNKGTAHLRVESIDAAHWNGSGSSTIVQTAPLSNDSGLSGASVSSAPAPAVVPRVQKVAPTPVSPATQPEQGIANQGVVPGDYLQVAAFSTQQAAVSLSQRLKQELGESRAKVTAATVNGQQLYRVKIGPLRPGEDVTSLTAGLQGIGLSQPYIVRLP
ncbi:septal ring lytic transglycosylase RlpA family protein [Pokkaliibacter sp. CJK22405]|uniref:septal ring lytic transglycosylase RlpA family protein n=1 Tax=Pokkaliibacter sp. CJK22405 TaxID=3384615 RepID=UPI003984A417